jgi:sterol 3beta-glucosyltransferase
MSEIAVVASGTRGDVQPYVALGKGLQDAGYKVRLLASENFESLATEAGLRFYSTGIGPEERLQSEEWRKVIEGGNFISILAKMQSEAKKFAGDSARRTPDLLKDVDLIITGMAGMGGTFSVAEKYHIPLIQAYVFPFTPTREFATPLVARLPLGAALNRASFHLTHQMFWQTSKLIDQLTRETLGMSKAPFWGPFGALARAKTPTMYGYSKYVLPRPQDWGDHEQVTGYWFLDEPQGWQPPADLVRFLDAGDAPVYIGFGSMGSRNPEESGRLALEALAKSGRRGVLASGWGGLQPKDLPDSVYLLSSIPHSWLFPRMAAVVHHGGAGTTAAGLRAGVPSIIVPFSADQPFWARRVADLGVGTQPIPRKQLTAERLAQAIQQAVSDETMRRKASALGENIRAENGIANAVGMVSRLMQQKLQAVS